jgi:hypothetical protein
MTSTIRLKVSQPVVVWAALGGASCALIVAVLGRWVSGGVRAVDPGPDRFDSGSLALLRVLEWSQFAVMLVLIAVFVVRPLVRRAELGFDGLFILAAVALNFWDPLDNYLVFSFQYNAHMINVQSWGELIPGWASGPDVWAVPLLFVVGAYTWAFFAAARLGDRIVKRLEVARPGWTAVQRFSVVFIIMAVIEAVAENVYLQTRAIANIGTPDALTLNSDVYNGWPIYNPILFGLAWTAVAWLRWSRDERGLSAVERGVDQLGIDSRPARAVLRFLAIFAFVQVSYIVLYFVPWNLFALFHDARPPLPSFFPVP